MDHTSVKINKKEDVCNNKNNLCSKSKAKNLNNEIDEERIIDKTLCELTSVEECLTVAMHEYNIERNKKQSFDDRAGITITVLVAIIIAIYDKIPLKEIYYISNEPLTFVLLKQIITTIMIYLLLLVTFYYSIKILKVKTIENFDIFIINNDFISAAKIDSVAKLLEAYLNLTEIHRNKNNYLAKQLEKSQVTMIVVIILIFINLQFL